jgi:hypothetical protein
MAIFYVLHRALPRSLPSSQSYPFGLLSLYLRFRFISGVKKLDTLKYRYKLFILLKIMKHFTNEFT